MHFVYKYDILDLDSSASGFFRAKVNGIVVPFLALLSVVIVSFFGDISPAHCTDSRLNPIPERLQVKTRTLIMHMLNNARHPSVTTVKNILNHTGLLSDKVDMSSGIVAMMGFNGDVLHRYDIGQHPHQDDILETLLGDGISERTLLKYDAHSIPTKPRIRVEDSSPGLFPYAIELGIESSVPLGKHNKWMHWSAHDFSAQDPFYFEYMVPNAEDNRSYDFSLAKVGDEVFARAGLTQGVSSNPIKNENFFELPLTLITDLKLFSATDVAEADMHGYAKQLETLASDMALIAQSASYWTGLGYTGLVGPMLLEINEKRSAARNIFSEAAEHDESLKPNF